MNLQFSLAFREFGVIAFGGLHKESPKTPSLLNRRVQFLSVRNVFTKAYQIEFVLYHTATVIYFSRTGSVLPYVVTYFSRTVQVSRNLLDLVVSAVACVCKSFTSKKRELFQKVDLKTYKLKSE
jgi:hypothetical protein